MFTGIKIIKTVFLATLYNSFEGASRYDTDSDGDISAQEAEKLLSEKPKAQEATKLAEVETLDGALDLMDTIDLSDGLNPMEQKTIQYVITKGLRLNGQGVKDGSIDGIIGTNSLADINNLTGLNLGSRDEIDQEILNTINNKAQEISIEKAEEFHRAAEAARLAAEAEAAAEAARKLEAYRVVAAFDAEADISDAEKVKALQTELKALGYTLRGKNGGVDGIWTTNGTTAWAYAQAVVLAGSAIAEADAANLADAAAEAAAAAGAAVDTTAVTASAKPLNEWPDSLDNDLAQSVTYSWLVRDWIAALTAALPADQWWDSQVPQEGDEEEIAGGTEGSESLDIASAAQFLQAGLWWWTDDTSEEDATPVDNTQTPQVDPTAKVAAMGEHAWDEVPLPLPRPDNIENISESPEVQMALAALELMKREKNKGAIKALQEEFEISVDGDVWPQTEGAVRENPEEAMEVLAKYIKIQDNQSVTARLESETPKNAEAIDEELAVLATLTSERAAELLYKAIAERYTGEGVSADERNINAQYIALKLQRGMKFENDEFAQDLLEAIMAEGKGHYENKETALADALFHGSGIFADYMRTLGEDFEGSYYRIAQTVEQPAKRDALHEKMSKSGIEGWVAEVIKELLGINAELLTTRVHILTGRWADGSVDMSVKLAGAMQLENAYYDADSGAIYATMQNGCEGNLVVIPVETFDHPVATGSVADTRDNNSDTGARGDGQWSEGIEGMSADDKLVELPSITVEHLWDKDRAALRWVSEYPWYVAVKVNSDYYYIHEEDLPLLKQGKNQQIDLTVERWSDGEQLNIIEAFFGWWFRANNRIDSHNVRDLLEDDTQRDIYKMNFEQISSRRQPIVETPEEETPEVETPEEETPEVETPEEETPEEETPGDDGSGGGDGWDQDGDTGGWDTF